MTTRDSTTLTGTGPEGAPADVAGAPAGDGKARRSNRTWLDLLEAYALLVITLGIVVVFATLPSSATAFGTLANARIIIADQAILLTIALAVLVPMVANVWDFSPASTAGLAAIVAASVASESSSVLGACVAAVAAGLVVGAVNGLLVTVAKVNSVIATFGMTTVIAGIIQWRTDGRSIVEGIPAAFSTFGSGTLLGVPRLALVGLAAALVVYYALRLTPFGRYLYAIGSSRASAGLVGIRVERLTFAAFVIAGGLAGVAGILIVARTGAGNPTVGPDFILPAYAAVFLGAIAVHPGRWNVGGVVIAIAFLGVLNSGLTLAGASPWVNLLVNGVALLGGVGVANFIARRRGRTLSTS
jgi:ribose transport system permease protein